MGRHNLKEDSHHKNGVSHFKDVAYLNVGLGGDLPMKNKEKFAEQIVNIAIQNDGFAVVNCGEEVTNCRVTNCEKCIFGKHKDCEVAKKEWAESEYERMWSNVPVDTQILVSNDKLNWYHRHFASVNDKGVVYAFDSGTTSWTCTDEIKETSPWEYAKLPSEEEKEET